MARDFVWRRNYWTWNTGAEGFESDPVNGEWQRFWVNLATLTTGQTLTRLLLDAQFRRMSSIAGDSQILWSSPVVLGVYLAADPNQFPTLNPWVDESNQSWMWWEAQSIQDQVKKPDSDDYWELISFRIDTSAQRKAKVNATNNTAVWLVWAQQDPNAFTQPGWQISQISTGVGVLLP